MPGAMRRSSSFLVATLVLAAGTLAALPDRTARAATPIPADELEIREIVLSLSDPATEGRAPGTQGIERAAALVSGLFDRVGLTPAGDGGTWFQSFTSPKVSGATMRNVIGILPGTGEGFVIVGAHYDHLGLDADRALMPGADDNASGVAALFRIAKELKEDPSQHRRSVLFIAWSGEELGLLGSRWYVEHPVKPLESTYAMVNLDTVGRMEGKSLIALDASSAAELPAALRGVNLAFGLDLSVPEKSPQGSDQVSFIEKGIPAVHFFTGANSDYHRSSDTPDKLSYQGILRVASFSAELVRYLADREAPLTFIAPATAAARPPTAASGGAPARRSSIGTIPDFTWSGPGVQISGAVPGSPAEKAGFRKGDRIVAIDGEKINGIEDYTAVLRAHSPGDKVRVTYSRDGKEETVEIVLAERK
jgi:aminopeptidase N